MKSIVHLIVATAAVLMTGCRSVIPLTRTSDPTSSATPVQTASPVPTTPPPATPTAETPTLAPTVTITFEPLSGQVWDAENAASAQSTELLLPDYATGIYWPGNTRALVYLNSSFLEIYLDPLMTGVTTMVDAPGSVMGIAPDGSGLIYQGGDGGLLLWDRATQSSTVVPFGGAAYFAAYSPDGQTIAIGAVDSWKVTLYDRATMQPFKTLTGFETAAPVYSAIPGPKRGVLAWVARGKLQFQDISSSALGGESGYQDFIMGIAFSPDGMRAAVISGGLLQVINTSVQGDAAAQDLIVASPETPVTAAAFSPDGALVAAGVGRDVLIWETASWTQVATLPQSGAVRLVSFSPGGRALVIVNDNNLLKSWRIP